MTTSCSNRAKALLVDREALRLAQADGDIMAANGALADAFSSDGRPLLAELREETGLWPDPLEAYPRSMPNGYGPRRALGGGSGWGG